MSEPKAIIIVDGEPIEVDLLAQEAPQQCDDCGKVDELRPYGPGGSMVCFDCGMKDEAEVRRQFASRFGFDGGTEHE